MEKKIIFFYNIAQRNTKDNIKITAGNWREIFSFRRLAEPFKRLEKNV